MTLIVMVVVNNSRIPRQPGSKLRLLCVNNVAKFHLFLKTIEQLGCQKDDMLIIYKRIIDTINNNFSTR